MERLANSMSRPLLLATLLLFPGCAGGAAGAVAWSLVGYVVSDKAIDQWVVQAVTTWVVTREAMPAAPVLVPQE